MIGFVEKPAKFKDLMFENRAGLIEDDHIGFPIEAAGKIAHELQTSIQIRFLRDGRIQKNGHIHVAGRPCFIFGEGTEQKDGLYVRLGAEIVLDRLWIDCIFHKRIIGKS